ncbi:MAG: MATE family efflux transporter [Bdellovibrionales bacterium]
MKNHWKRIFSMAWPLIVANSFWTLQMTIDRVFLGAYSIEALGAAMAVMGVFWTPMALLQQTSAYVTTFVAQYLGSENRDNIGVALWQGIYFSVIGGVAFLFLNFFSEDFFSLVGHEAKVKELEVLYYNSIAFSALPTALVAAFSGFFTGLGRTRVVMEINGVGLALNVLFDYLFIFGNLGFPALGIEGAGYATAIAGVGSAVYGAIKVFSARHESDFKVLSRWQWNADIMKRFIKYGLPSGLQWALEGMAFTVFLIFIGRFPNGAAALAASSIAVTVMMLSVLPSMGVAQSVMALVGQHIGEGRPQDAVRDTYIGVQMSALYIFIAGLSFVVFPQFYIMWFENNQNQMLWAQVSEIASILLILLQHLLYLTVSILTFHLHLRELATHVLFL